jgi:hypothetical protein
LGSHLRSQRANEPSLEPETISSAQKINYMSPGSEQAAADMIDEARLNVFRVWY